jgi:hypothetical protein
LQGNKGRQATLRLDALAPAKPSVPKPIMHERTRLPVSDTAAIRIAKTLALRGLDGLRDISVPHIDPQGLQIRVDAVLDRHDIAKTDRDCLLATLNAFRSLMRQLKLQDCIRSCMLPDASDPGGTALVSTGLWERVLPVTAIPKALADDNDTPLSPLVQALFVLWTYEQRALRCLAHLDRGDHVRLRKELNNRGYESWRPCDWPGWLVMQVECDIMIRDLQVNSTMYVHICGPCM